MKKYNNSLTNKITKLAFLFSVLLCFSCKNVLENQDNFQSIPKGKAYLVINAGDITARTIKPDSDESLLTQFTSFTLSGTGKDAGNKSLSLTVSATDIKDLYNKQILLDAGTWTFTLKAFLGNQTFTATTSDVLIEEGKVNSVSFNLQTNDTKGGLSVKINFDKTNVSKINTTLTKLDDDNDDSNDEVIDSKSQTSFGYNYPSTGLPSGYITYERLSNSLMVEAGEYRLVFEFYWNDTEKLNTFQYIVHIAKGVRTSFVKTVDLNEVFKITYNGKSSSPTAYIANGQTLVEKYSRKSEDIILPRYNRQDRLFGGWWTTSDESGEVVTKIPHNSNKDITLYAHWISLNSGDPVTIYVNPEAEGHYGFSEEYGLESLEAAMETIERANCMNQNHDWIIKIKGEISGSHVISTDVNNVKEHVKSITLEGSTVSGAGQTEPQDCLKGGITTATENGAVLSVQIPVPVIIKNLKITGGNNTNTGDIKGGGIYVGDGSTVTLDDGALITGNTASKGAGIYCDGNLKIQGSAVVEDDIYLAAGKKLIISGPLTSTVNTIATITPAEYTPGTVILEAASGSEVTLDSALVGKFSVSDAEGREWGINTEGQLVKKPIVTFNSNGGTAITSQTITYGSTATEPAAPTKSAFEFKGWFTDENLTEPFSFSTPITSDITLYAKFNNVIGGILMTDGTFISSSEITSENVSNIVGVVYKLYENEIGIIGIRSNTTKLRWAESNTTGVNTKFENIVCSKNGGSPVSFSGDLDGRDNWEEIRKVDTSAEASNYPAFNYAITYGTSLGAAPELATTNYKEGWYLPTIAELYDVAINISTLNDTFTLINSANGSANLLLSDTTDGYYWSSSQTGTDTQAYYVWMGSGNPNSETKNSQNCVCVVMTIPSI